MQEHDKESYIEMLLEDWPTDNSEDESAFEAFCEDYLNSKW